MSPLALILLLAVIFVDDTCSIWPTFQFLALDPISKVESAFGTKLEVRSAAIVRESVSASPMLMFPPMWPWLHAGTKPINEPKYIMQTYLHYV